jgi:hypothetical protein
MDDADLYGKIVLFGNYKSEPDTGSQQIIFSKVLQLSFNFRIFENHFVGLQKT